MRGTWNIKGLVFTTAPQPKTAQGMREKQFVVRYTADNIGKSLSIADEKSGVMFQIPFDGIYAEIMKDAKRHGNGGGDHGKTIN